MATATTQYEVIAPELTLHRQVGELTDPISGQTVGIQQGRGRTVVAGTIVSSADLSPILLEALEDEDHPSYDYATKVLREVSDDPNEETFGEPIAGYDDLDEEQILAVLGVLPSAQAQAVKAYEASHENRSIIVNYSIGFGESPEARQTGVVSSDLDDTDESKAAAQIRTREVVDDDIVEPGEGVTGTGERAIAPGTAASEDDKGSKKTVPRRGRRQRPAGSQTSGDSSGDGGSGSGSGE